ncbi:MAG: hypothetical protein ACTSX6_12755 [Candidatus Heimdallarchaeaceae archaeon]
MIYSAITPCRKKKGFEGIPEKLYDVSLSQLTPLLLANLPSFSILRKTKVMIVLLERATGKKISIFPSLRVFIHGNIEKKEAENILSAISKSIESII